MKVEEAWSIGDIFNGMMAFTNLIGLVGLAGLAMRSVKGYLNKIDSLNKA
jgi:AGCS family alanine or glycine:cation symporter